jgi:hypothetical protein
VNAHNIIASSQELEYCKETGKTVGPHEETDNLYLSYDVSMVTVSSCNETTCSSATFYPSSGGKEEIVVTISCFFCVMVFCIKTVAYTTTSEQLEEEADFTCPLTLFQ